MHCESTGFNFQDVLLLVGLKRRTGELTIESGNNIGHMLFYGGKILQSMSPYSRAIGDLLVEEGLITEMELIETLKLQKKNPASPIGALLLKTGKVTFEVVEMMVLEQIRQAVKEFKTWENVSLSFHEKDIQPFDRIHLTIHEFLEQETLKNALYFLSMGSTPHDQSAAEAPSPTTA
jgi:glutaredoxin-related protein